MNTKPLRIALLLVALLSAAFAHAAEGTYREQWRPQYHFTPATNWMNDPNGMVFYDGEYHLFYQFNPWGIQWGHMSWGHAVSRDLLHWEHLPIALYEANDVMIFSGSAVVDWENTSGFGRNGKPPMVAIYTGHYTRRPLQNQHVAYSNDRGRTWTKFAGNPVLDIGEKDFRDPKVQWHGATKQWVMAVSWPIQRKVRFYASPNLRDWTHLSDFGPAGSTNGIWECPDLFPLKVEGRRGIEKWVLVVNVGSGAPAGGSGCQYFVGNFDGKEFQPDGTHQNGLWADFGPDFYAAVSWSDIPRRDGRRLWLGWMSNWQYANDVPTEPWRSAMSIPRELRLRETSEGLRLVQSPVRELTGLRGGRERFKGGTIEEANAWLKRNAIRGEQFELTCEFPANRDGTQGLKLFSNSTEETLIGVDHTLGRVFVDRTRSGNVTFHSKFPGAHGAPLTERNRPVTLHLFVDACSVEVFVNNGETVLTELVLPSEHSHGLEFWERSSHSGVSNIAVWPLESIWRTAPKQ